MQVVRADIYPRRVCGYKKLLLFCLLCCPSTSNFGLIPVSRAARQALEEPGVTHTPFAVARRPLKQTRTLVLLWVLAWPQHPLSDAWECCHVANNQRKSATLRRQAKKIKHCTQITSHGYHGVDAGSASADKFSFNSDSYPSHKAPMSPLRLLMEVIWELCGRLPTSTTTH